MIIAALAAALTVPGPGEALNGPWLSWSLTIVAFILQGLNIDIQSILRGGKVLRLFVWGFLVAYLLAPALASACGAAFRMKDDDLVGLLLICCMTPTIASGVIISGRAGADRTTAIVLTVALVFTGLLVIPLGLNIVFARSTAIDGANLTRQLLLTVLVPMVLGQAIRLAVPALVRRPAFQRVNRDLPPLLIGLLVYSSLAPHADRLLHVSAARLIVLVLTAGIVHGTLLGVGYLTAKRLLAVDRQKSLALAFVSSQKSVAMGAPIWSSLFAASFPLAILPPIVFHALQTLLDGFLATRLRRIE